MWSKLPRTSRDKKNITVSVHSPRNSESSLIATDYIGKMKKAVETASEIALPVITGLKAGVNDRGVSLEVVLFVTPAFKRVRVARIARKAVFNGLSHATVLLSLIQKRAHISYDGRNEPRRG